MEIKTVTKENATIMQLIGSLDGNTVNEAQDKILPLLNGKISLVLDLKECGYVSSAGLRLLLMTAKTLSASGGVLLLSGLSSEVKDVMEMTGFSHFFKMLDSVDAALKELRKGG